MLYPETSELYPPLEEFSEFINSMGLALDLDSPLNLGGLLPEHDPPPDASNRVRSNKPTAPITRNDPDEDQIECPNRTQILTLLPIPLNPWSK